MATPIHTDAIGRPIAVGDFVFANDCVQRVVKINAKTISASHNLAAGPTTGEKWYPPKRVVVLPKDEAMCMYLLTKV